MRIERTADPPPDWDAIHAEDPRATMFLHPRWMDAITRAYPFYRPLYLVAEAGGSVAGILPLVQVRRWGLDQFLSLPFGAHGAVGASSRRPSTAAQLAVAFRPGHGDENPALRDVHSRPEFRTRAAPAPPSFFQDFQTHVIDLEGGPEGLWRGTGEAPSAASGPPRAGVLVGLERGGCHLTCIGCMKNRVEPGWGLRPIPGSDPLHRRRLRQDARLYTARLRDEVIAACLCLEHGGREVHPWVSGAAPAARELGAFHFLIDAALRDAALRGCKTWYFGGSGGNRRIEFFKESFSARPVPLLRCFHMAGWARRLRRRPEGQNPAAST
jgi:hypothetical protein